MRPAILPRNSIPQIGDRPASSSVVEDIALLDRELNLVVTKACIRFGSDRYMGSVLSRCWAAFLPEPWEGALWGASVQGRGIQLQAAESVLCWVSCGHCHSVFAEGGSMRTFFGRGISQHSTRQQTHIHTHTHTDTETHVYTETSAATQRTAAQVKTKVAEAWGIANYTPQKLAQHFTN